MVSAAFLLTSALACLQVSAVPATQNERRWMCGSPSAAAQDRSNQCMREKAPDACPDQDCNEECYQELWKTCCKSNDGKVYGSLIDPERFDCAVWMP
ncbi:hypothetical protein PG984_012960 [Apiospora sp. TS-2023a]